MRMRERSLPLGWYPQSPSDIEGLIAQWSQNRPRKGACAAIAPHAGWGFSGRLAALSLLSLADAETIVVIGGHLPRDYPVLAAMEESFETPLGGIQRDNELYSALASRLRLEEDRARDNTVEVQLPLVKALFPQARLLWLRAPAGQSSLDLGLALAEAAGGLGRDIVCLGSTDLTHYGPDYGFEPMGRGARAETWVREVSDRGFIDALLDMDGPTALLRGEEGAACSAGAAVAALGFAQALGCDESLLLGYGTSLDVRRAPSFVGYCSLAFYKPAKVSS